MKIAILGAGGVGATVAGALVKHDNTELILIARGETKEIIKDRGWILESELLGNHIIRPALVSDNPEEIGVVDVFVLCCKSYSIDEVCKRYESIVDAHTVVIPLQNGFTSATQAQKALGRGQIAHGCIYCLSEMVEKGKVVNSGTLLRLAFGFPDGHKNELAEQFAQMLQSGGLPTQYTKDILKIVWSKYLMIAGNSSIFLYYDTNVGGIAKNKKRLDFLLHLYQDIFRLAKAVQISLDEDLPERYLEEFKAMPDSASSSLYRDIKAKTPQNELEQIIGNGVRLARENHIEVPFLAAAYDKTLQTML